MENARVVGRGRRDEGPTEARSLGALPWVNTSLKPPSQFPGYATVPTCILGLSTVIRVHV